MSGATFFIRECPTCGRRLQVRVEYLGKLVKCQHCHGQFEAIDDASISAQESAILSRVDELLASPNVMPHRPR